MNSRHIQCCWVVLVATFALIPAVQGQSSTSSLQGEVTDSSGGAIAGATIQVENLASGSKRETSSGEGGRYFLPQLSPGIYSLSAQSTGFAKLAIASVRLAVNSTSTVNLQFVQLAGVTETVAVSAEAESINTTDASLGNAFGTRPILQLPLNARNVAGLLSLQPGVTYLSDDPGDIRSQDIRNGSVNGARRDQSNVTLDGVDVNDQQTRQAFASVLRNTQDSVQEFRVVTSNPGAEQGRSSGAQVALITKGGTNGLHGSAYEFHRNTITSANDFFNNRVGVARPKLIRNIFGASVSGPIRKNRVFFFTNYEGRRDASESNVTRVVPSTELRQGIIRYQASGGGTASVSPAQIRAADPLGIGTSPAVLSLLRSFPEPNDSTISRGINTSGYRFLAKTPLRWNTYIAKLDWSLGESGAHTMFLRGNLQNDNALGVPQLPGQPASNLQLNNSKGLAFGYNHTLSPTFVGSFRYGFTRQGLETTGVNAPDIVALGIADPLIASTRGLSSILPVHTLSEDLTLTRGAHTIQFGGTMRSIRNRRLNYANSFNSASLLAYQLTDGALPAVNQFPGLAASNVAEIAGVFAGLLGAVNVGNGVYNYDLEGNVLPSGQPVRRTFGLEEYEVYVQDIWRASKNLTITAGLRWSLMPPVREVNGFQASVSPSYTEFVDRRIALAESGQPSRDAGRLGFVGLNSPGGEPLYAFHKKNFGPRLAIAYSAGKTSIRAGGGIFYDAFGMALMQQLDAGTFGLTSQVRTPAGVYSLANTPRFTSINQIPAGLIPLAPRGGPGTAPDTFGASSFVDQAIRPPYSASLNFSLGRQLPGGFFIEGSYVGRLSRRSLISDSGASQMANFGDPRSGMTLFEASTILEQNIKRGVPQSQVQPVPFWENLYSRAARNGLSPTQVVYQAFQATPANTSTTIVALDTRCQPACSDLGAYTFLSPQFWSARAYRSQGIGNYHSMQWSLRKRFSQGYQFDFNYTLSKSIDQGSFGETGYPIYDFYPQRGVVNSWNRRQERAVSDYDMRHQLNLNWVAELPFGRGRRFAASAGPVLNALVGGWQLSGIVRNTSGLPLSIFAMSVSSWASPSWAKPLGQLPPQTNDKNAPGAVSGSGPNVFSNPALARTLLDNPLPGDSGVRNMIRGHGIFSADVGFGKRFVLPLEGHSLQFRAEAFNLTNSVRFNGNSRNLSIESAPSTFGQYTSVLVPPRVIQFGFRYEF